MLTRTLSAAARLDRWLATRVVPPLNRLDRAAGARLWPAAEIAVLRLLRLVRLVVLRPTDRLAALVADWLLPPSATVPDGTQHGTHRSAGNLGRPRLPWRAPVREIALCSGLVLLAGLAAVGVRDPDPQRAVTAGAVAGPSSAFDRPVPQPPSVVEPGRARSEARTGVDLAIPAPARPPAQPAPAAPPKAPAAPAPTPVVERWLPTGTGMWLHDWERSEGGSARAVVERARSSGFTHLYVQTGSTKKGWIGDPVLTQLLPATVGTDLKIIAWDFPKLIDPVADAHRMARAAQFSRPGLPRVAAVAPDVETPAEGTRLTPARVNQYYKALRAALPDDIAILATVPWPSEKRTGSYPYTETARWSDAFVPMAYWYNRRPDVVTDTSMRWLSRFRLPVMPVGQGYDGRIDAPYLPPDPDPAASVQAFVDAARAGGARSISLWSWQTTGVPQWDVLARASTGPWSGPWSPAS
ncbi:MAG TPA: hypothetical protein VNU26_06445 [Mycobacteriales bacterium]|nr:hypothetical protein [Mycobacteriales bacterium]